MYHSVGGGLYDNISPARFEKDIAYLRRNYEIVDLPEVVSTNTDEKRVALTFDDGYRDFYRNVVPILRKFEVPATVFVITSALFNGEFRQDANFDYEYMSLSQARELVDDEFITIGNHTRTHPKLDQVSDRKTLEEEIIGAKRDLEEALTTPITRFCYPYNRWSLDSIDVVRHEHEIAVNGSSRDALTLADADPLRLPRANGAVPAPNLKTNITDRRIAYRWLRRRADHITTKISR